MQGMLITQENIFTFSIQMTNRVLILIFETTKFLLFSSLR